MSDPFSIGAGIVGVLGLTIQVTQFLVKYGMDWKDAPSSIQGFLQELEDLNFLLLKVGTKFGSDGNFRAAFEGQSSNLPSSSQPLASASVALPDTIMSTKNELQTLVQELEAMNEKHRYVWKRLKYPFLAKRLQISVHTLHRYCKSLDSLINVETLSVGSRIQNEVQQIRNEHREWHGVTENRRILRWLSQLSFEERHRDILSKRLQGTGEWFLNLDDYKMWRNGSLDVSATMWCSGIPGAGKSVMTSIVIENLQRVFPEDDVSILYVYCDYKARESQTTETLLSSLVKQLALQLKDMPHVVKDLYTKHGNGQSSPTRAEYLELFGGLGSGFRRYFVVIDALDENLVHGDEDKMLEANIADELQTLQSRDPEGRAFSMFLTSRPLISTNRYLSKSLHCEIRAADLDVQLYVRSRILNENFRFAKDIQKKTDLENDIVAMVVQKAQGMFLLPRLHLDRLACQTSIRGLRDALSHLPTKLDETYDDAIHRIRSQVEEHTDLAMRALGWISNAVRPLTTRELLEALAVAPGDRKLDTEALTNPDIIISVTAGLLTIDLESGIFRLVHFTVGKYLAERRADLFPNINETITEVCLTYLMFDAFGNHVDVDKYERFYRKLQNLLLDYAATWWGAHIKKGLSSSVDALALEFLQNQRKVLSCLQIMREHTPVDDTATGVHLAAYLGLVQLLRELLERGMAAAARDSFGKTPLHLAASQGHLVIAQILLCRNDVDPDSDNGHGITPLHEAAKHGRQSIVELLANHNDVDPDCKDVIGKTPLMHAASLGHTEVVNQLADRQDVDVNGEDKYGWTALSWAVESKQIDVIKSLLDREDVNVGHKDRFGRSLLSRAVFEDSSSSLMANGETTMQNIEAHPEDWIVRSSMSFPPDSITEIVNLLLSRGVTIAGSLDQRGRTPLSYTIQYGNPETFRLLLSCGESLADSHDSLGRTPLSYAAEYGHLETVKLLLDRADAAVNREDNVGRTPLSYAADGGHLPTFELLMNCKDADLLAMDEAGRSPVVYATLNGQASIVEMLLDQDILTADDKYKFGATLLCWAAYRGHTSMIELLLTGDEIKINDTDDKGRTPLMCAAFHGHTWIVNLFLARDDVHVDMKDDLGRTALSYAASRGQTSDVEILLARDDVDADNRDHEGRTPLSYAAEGGHISVVDVLLLRDDVEADCRDKQGRTPLLYAAQKGQTPVIDVLKARDDVNPHCEDVDGRTPYEWAEKSSSDGDEFVADWYPSLDDEEDSQDYEEEYGSNDDANERHSSDEQSGDDRGDSP